MMVRLTKPAEWSCSLHQIRRGSHISVKTRNEDNQRDSKRSSAKQDQSHCKGVKVVIVVTKFFLPTPIPFKGGSYLDTLVTTFCQPLRISGTRFLLRVVVYNIPIFSKSCKIRRKKFKTFESYLYFALKRKFMHAFIIIQS